MIKKDNTKKQERMNFGNTIIVMTYALNVVHILTEVGISPGVIGTGITVLPLELGTIFCALSHRMEGLYI
jgi:hypothetical protein